LLRVDTYFNHAGGETPLDTSPMGDDSPGQPVRHIWFAKVANAHFPAPLQGGLWREKHHRRIALRPLKPPLELPWSF